MILTLKISAMMVYSIFINDLLANGVGTLLGFVLLLIFGNTKWFSGQRMSASL